MFYVLNLCHVPLPPCLSGEFGFLQVVKEVLLWTASVPHVTRCLELHDDPVLRVCAISLKVRYLGLSDCRAHVLTLPSLPAFSVLHGRTIGKLFRPSPAGDAASPAHRPRSALLTYFEFSRFWASFLLMSLPNSWNLPVTFSFMRSCQNFQATLFKSGLCWNHLGHLTLRDDGPVGLRA